ncbi:unnamed protein product, partial [Amoebophrya sp. A25]|eukprot:GSA25T00013924001.1
MLNPGNVDYRDGDRDLTIPRLVWERRKRRIERKRKLAEAEAAKILEGAGGGVEGGEQQEDGTSSKNLNSGTPKRSDGGLRQRTKSVTLDLDAISAGEDDALTLVSPMSAALFKESAVQATQDTNPRSAHTSDGGVVPPGTPNNRGPNKAVTPRSPEEVPLRSPEMQSQPLVDDGPSWLDEFFLAQLRIDDEQDGSPSASRSKNEEFPPTSSTSKKYADLDPEP